MSWRRLPRLPHRFAGPLCQVPCACSSVRGPARRPPRPLCFAGFLLLLFLWCLGCGVDITIVVPPPSPVVSLPESWLLFSHSPARSLLLSPSLLRACLYGVGLLLELLPVLARGRCWLSYTLCFILFFLLSSADFPAKFPGLLEHLPHFVRVCTT